MESIEPQKPSDQYTCLASTVAPDRGELRNDYEAQLLQEQGWAMRAVMGDNIFNIADHRTIGLQENFGHPDIQIYYDIAPITALETFENIVKLIKTGHQFKDGDTSPDIAEDLTVKFIAITIKDVAMLRMIIPDQEGRFEEDAIGEPFVNQYDNRVLP